MGVRNNQSKYDLEQQQARAINTTLAVTVENRLRMSGVLVQLSQGRFETDSFLPFWSYRLLSP